MIEYPLRSIHTNHNSVRDVDGPCSVSGVNRPLYWPRVCHTHLSVIKYLLSWTMFVRSFAYANECCTQLEHFDYMALAYAVIIPMTIRRYQLIVLINLSKILFGNSDVELGCIPSSIQCACAILFPLQGVGVLLLVVSPVLLHQCGERLTTCWYRYDVLYVVWYCLKKIAKKKLFCSRKIIPKRSKKISKLEW